MGYRERLSMSGDLPAQIWWACTRRSANISISYTHYLLNEPIISYSLWPTNARMRKEGAQNHNNQKIYIIDHWSIACFTNTSLSLKTPFNYHKKNNMTQVYLLYSYLFSLRATITSSWKNLQTLAHGVMSCGRPAMLLYWTKLIYGICDHLGVL